MGWKKGLRIQLLCRQDRQFHGLWTCQSVWMDYDLTWQWKNYPFSCMIIPFVFPMSFVRFSVTLWFRILSQVSDWGVLREQLSQCLNEDAAAAYEARLSQERKHVGCHGFIAAGQWSLLHSTTCHEFREEHGFQAGQQSTQTSDSQNIPEFFS